MTLMFLILVIGIVFVAIIVGLLILCICLNKKDKQVEMITCNTCGLSCPNTVIYCAHCGSRLNK